MKRVLTKKFFMRPTLRVAGDLLGKFLARRTGRRTICGMITEVEAYDGFDDKASHASRGITRRNRIMFEDGGVWYVYLVYGMHEMLNIVTRERGYPAAILIRSVAVSDVSRAKTNGPGKVTAFFKISRSFNGERAARSSGLWIEDRGIRPKKIFKAKRIGIDYAGRWKHALRRLYADSWARV